MVKNIRLPLQDSEIDAIEHITMQGERWDQIAWRYYGDASRLSEIIEANPHINIDDVLGAGILVLVPLIEDKITENREELPPWKR